MRWARPVAGWPTFLTRLIRGSALALSLCGLARLPRTRCKVRCGNLKQREKRNKGRLNLFAGIIDSRSLVVSQSFCPSVILSAAQPYFFFFLDVDDCTEMTDNCDVNAYCNNTVGSFNCTCNFGFTGNGTTCAGKYDYFVVDESCFYFIPQSHACSAQKSTTCFQFSQNLQLMARKDDILTKISDSWRTKVPRS